MSFSEDMRYLKTGLFSKLLLESSGFCQRAISEEKHSSELKLSGYNKDYMRSNIGEILCFSFSHNSLSEAKTSVNCP
jgi:hypothetical protein